jgi:hypothetical protein
VRLNEIELLAERHHLWCTAVWELEDEDELLAWDVLE